MLGVGLRLSREGLFALLMVVAAPLAGAGRWGLAVAEPSSLGPPIRVLLVEAPLITIGAAGKQGLQVRDQAGQVLVKVDPGRQLRVGRMGRILTLQLLPKGPLAAPPPPVALGPRPDPAAPMENAADSAGRSWPLQELQLEPIDRRDLMVVKQRRYRGTLLLRPAGEGLQAINQLPLEIYLTGVVGSEMPGSWPLAALKAQAVASRTYALQQLRPKAPFDVKATVANQVYKGVEAESAPTLEAVISTRTQVLMHGQHLINAVFHSSSGGMTENSGELWKRQLPYLVSVPDFDTSSPVSSWEKAFPPETLRQTFAETGGATTIQPIQVSSTGRLQRAKVIGPLGELVLTGNDLRTRLRLPSTLVRFQFLPAGRLEKEGSQRDLAFTESSAASQPSGVPMGSPNQALGQSPPITLVAKGRGYGHGVGMSQWGAYALALRGKTYEDILRHYYRGSVLRSY